MDELETLNIAGGRPATMPVVPEGSSLICGYDQGLGERMFVCESLEDMQTLYDAYAAGGALSINWYTGDDVGFVTIIQGSNAPSP